MSRSQNRTNGRTAGFFNHGRELRHPVVGRQAQSSCEVVVRCHGRLCFCAEKYSTRKCAQESLKKFGFQLSAVPLLWTAGDGTILAGVWLVMHSAEGFHLGHHEVALPTKTGYALANAFMGRITYDGDWEWSKYCCGECGWTGVGSQLVSGELLGQCTVSIVLNATTKLNYSDSRRRPRMLIGRTSR